MTSISIFDVDFSGELSDFTIVPHKLNYYVSGKSFTTDCYIVKASAITCDVTIEDILISLNGVPLLNNKNENDDGFFQKYFSSMVKTQSLLKTIRFLRCSEKSQRDSDFCTHMILSPSEAVLIYHEHWMKGDETENHPDKSSLIPESELSVRIQDLQTEKLRYIGDRRLELVQSSGACDLSENKIDGTMEDMLESVVAEQVEKEIMRTENVGYMIRLADLMAQRDAKDLELRLVDQKKLSALEEEHKKAAERVRLNLLAKEEYELRARQAEEIRSTEEAKREEDARIEEEIQRRVDKQLRSICEAQDEEFKRKLRDLEGIVTFEEIIDKRAQEEARRCTEDIKAEEAEIARNKMAEERALRVSGNKATFEFANARSPAIATVYDIVFAEQNMGLHLMPHVVTCRAMAGPLSTIDCCVVTKSDLADEIRAGDILLSVNDMPLRSYRMEGLTGPHPEFYPSILAALTTAEFPRVLRYFRLPDSDTVADSSPRDIGFADAILLLSDTH